MSDKVITGSYGGAGGNNNYSRPAGQNVGNFMTDRNSSRVLAPPGGGSQIVFRDDRTPAAATPKKSAAPPPPPAVAAQMAVEEEVVFVHFSYGTRAAQR